MSIKIQSEVWEHSKHRGSALLLLLALADNCGDESRSAWPSTDYLAKKTRLSNRAIHRLISELEASGELAVQRNRGRNRPNRYYIGHYSEDVGDMTGCWHPVPEDVGDIPFSENVSNCHILSEETDTSDEFVAEVKPDNSCTENVTFEEEILTNGAVKGDTPATSNHKEPSEPSVEPSGVTTWFSLLEEIPGWKTTFERAEQWRIDNHISEEVAKVIAYEILDKRKFSDDPQRNKWAIFRNWSEKRQRDVDAGIRTVSSTPPVNKTPVLSGAVDMEAFKREIESRQTGDDF